MCAEQIAFGDELRRMRKEMGMTQEKLAEKLDIDVKQLGKYEKGTYEMRASTYAKLLQLYNDKTRKQEDMLLQKIKNLSPSDRLMIEGLVARLSEPSRQS